VRRLDQLKKKEKWKHADIKIEKFTLNYNNF
jgi:hypothetical protein